MISEIAFSIAAEGIPKVPKNAIYPHIEKQYMLLSLEDHLLSSVL
jgi:hypothetical protein